MATSGAGSEGSASESEEQDDPSLLSPEEVLTAVVNNITLQDNNEEDALLAFRQQWQKELVTLPQRNLSSNNKQSNTDPDNNEQKAKELFLRGVELERCGKLYEAVQQYKKAVQLVPDVETRLYENTDRSDTPDKQGNTEIPELRQDLKAEDVIASDNDDDEDDYSGDGELYSKLQRILAKKGCICEPALPQKDGHISWLPYELVLLIIRWVVSSDLDATSLEKTGLVCRGLYVASRDQDIWRTLCARTWGLNCGSPKSQGFASWRYMYIQRPRLRLHGCYISKTTYLRHGENSFQDQFYRPWYLIAFYRYLRFFPEGLVLMWTTAEEPSSCVSLLKSRSYKHTLGIMAGHYRLVGDKVIIIVKKQSNEKKQSSNTRFRTRRKDNQHEQSVQTFQLELQVKSVRDRLNWQLTWCGYNICYRRGAADYSTNLDLMPNKFPPFSFSRVRHYTAESEAPLV